MGRIETDGLVLVDLQETMKLLGKSRATVFRLIQSSELIKVDVFDSRKTFVTLESIERFKNDGPQFQMKMLEPDTVRDKRRRELTKRFPSIFRQHPSPHKP